MLRKLFVFILLCAFSGLTIVAQEKDAASKPKKQIRKAFGIALGGSGSYLGVEVKEITNENFNEMGLTEVRGVGVSKVLKDSPAEKAGLQSGDVIVRFNGEVVTSTRKLTRLIIEVSPDHKAALTILRNGSEVEIPVTMGKRKGSSFFRGNFEFPEIPNVPVPDVQIATPNELGKNSLIWSLNSSRTIGVGVLPLTEQLGEYFGVSNGKGLLINRVSKDSPAERAGLKAGDVIVEINGKPVKRSFDLLRNLGDEKAGDATLTIVRDRNRQTVTVTPEKRKGGEMFFNGFEFGDLDESKLKLMTEKLNDLKIRVAPKIKSASMPRRIEVPRKVL